MSEKRNINNKKNTSSSYYSLRKTFIEKMFSPKEYIEFLKFCGHGNINSFNLYEQLEIFSNNPKATIVATYESWEKQQCKVSMFAEGIYNSSLKDFVYDVSQTDRKNLPDIWEINEENNDYILNELKVQNGYDFSSIKEYAQKVIQNIVNEKVKVQKNEIIINDRIFIVDISKINEKSFKNFIVMSTTISFLERCSIDTEYLLDDFEKSFDNLNVIPRLFVEAGFLASLTNTILCKKIYNIYKNGRRKNYENSTKLQENGTWGRSRISFNAKWNILSGTNFSKKRRRIKNDSRQIWNNETGISERELSRDVYGLADGRSTRGGSVESGPGSRGYASSNVSSASSTASAKSTKDISRELSTSSGSKGSNRGNDSKGNSGSSKALVDKKESNDIEESKIIENTYSQISLFEEELDNIEKDLDLEMKEEILDITYITDKNKKGGYLNPIKETVPTEYIKEVILRGSGFQNGKARICEIFSSEVDKTERINKIKKEYGQGGAGWPIEGYGLHGYDTFKSNGIRFQWRDENGEKEGYISWREVESEIASLILTGEYVTDLSKNEVKKNELEDDLFLEETKDLIENNNVIEKETLQVIKTDYKDIVEQLDIDFRDAMEILLQSSTLYVPYKPFLADIVYNDSLLMPIKLEFLSDVVLKSNKEKKGYSNNKYGLIEYTLTPYSIDINIKNRFGERKKHNTGYRELYEVLTTLVSKKDFVSIEQMERYHHMMQSDKDTLPDIYKLYLEKCEESIINLSKEKTTISKTNNELLNEKKLNFTYDNWELPKGGQKTKYKLNIEAIKTLKQLENENRAATKEEQLIMSYYVGWGGIPQAFDSQNSLWSSEYNELKNTLTKEEYALALSSVNTAFYTSPEIVNSIYSFLEKMGFNGGNILEPACGIGNFISSMPKYMRENSKIYGVEIDDISSRICKLLHPDAIIKGCGYEEVGFDNNFFDVVIGNVPFGSFKPYDKKYNKENYLIHDYFFIKALDNVRAGGVVAFITSKGTLDKTNTKFRKQLAEKADLLGAIRLPNTAFKENAGTEVTSDIIFLKKREQPAVDMPDWVCTALNNEELTLNSYFIQNPSQMLGKMIKDTRIYGGDSNYTICINEDESFNLTESLKKAIDNIDATYVPVDVLEEDMKTEHNIIAAIPSVKNYTFAILDNKVYFRKDSQMTEQKLSLADKKCLTEFCELKESLNDIVELQLEGCTEEELSDSQRILNKKYDEFIKNYGYINERKVEKLVGNDTQYPLLCSLEIEVEIDNQKIYTKAAIFTKQTINPRWKKTEIKNSFDALNVCINEVNEVDLDYISYLMSNESKEKIVNDLIGEIYKNPLKEDKDNMYLGYESSEQYLSGNIREKLRIAEEKNTDGQYNINIKALKEVMPKDLEASEISFRIGTSWVDIKDYEAFMYETFNTTYRYTTMSNIYCNKIKIQKNNDNMYYFIENKSFERNSILASKTFGTSRKSAYEIFEDCLNLKSIEVKDLIIDSDTGKEKYVLNKKETLFACEKAELIKEAFQEWLFKVPERRNKYVSFYNETFNSTVDKKFDGSMLTLPGSSSLIRLNPHQLNAVARIIRDGNTLLDHCVGAGKTMVMISACMELRRHKLANKPMVVVPNHLTMQFATEFLRLYPGANILLASKKDFEKKNRRILIGKIATGDYDAVIMAHSQFEKIPLSFERRKKWIEDEILKIENEVNYSKGKKSWSVKQLESKKKQLKTQLEKLLNEDYKDDLITFEQLGVDCLMVDEAHEYKNLSFVTKMNNVAGINKNGAKKATDLYLKKSYINEKYGNKNLVFATGTPLSNSMCEMYIFQKYLGENELIEKNINSFDAWASTFGEVVASLELSPEGGSYRLKNRFAKFTNLPELQSMYKSFADVQLSSMINLEVPKLKNDKYIIVESETNEYVKKIIDSFVERSEKIRNGNVDPSEDNMLKITHEAKLLGTDARLYDKNADVSNDTKLNKCIENIYKVYIEHSDIKATQMVFCDIGTPKYPKNENEFCVYDYIKEGLVKKGIPTNEICFIHDAKNDTQKKEMFNEVNNGSKRVIIGSTQKMGAGTNVQERLIAMHEIDIPWKPSDVEQREGRILRQGNTNKEVYIFRYVTKGTFDAYSWSIIENKQKFISQIRKGDNTSRSFEDVDEFLLSYAEVKAIASGNPLIKEKMDIDNNVSRLSSLKANHEQQKYNLQDLINIKGPKELKNLETIKAAIIKDIDICKNHNINEDTTEQADFNMKIGDVFYSEKEKAGEIITMTAKSLKIEEEKHISDYKGLSIYVSKKLSLYKSDFLIKVKGSYEYLGEMGESYEGNIQRIENIIKKIPEKLSIIDSRIENCLKNIEEAKKEYDKPFSREEEYKALLKKQKEINALLYDKKEENIEVDKNEQVIKISAI